MLTCENCRFLHGGECRRHAPVFVPMLARTMFPAMDRQDAACGDHEPEWPVPPVRAVRITNDSNGPITLLGRDGATVVLPPGGVYPPDHGEA